MYKKDITILKCDVFINTDWLQYCLQTLPSSHKTDKVTEGEEFDKFDQKG